MPSQTLLAVILLWWMFNSVKDPPKKTKKRKGKSVRFPLSKQDVLLYLMILTIISPDILSEFIKIIQLLQ